MLKSWIKDCILNEGHDPGEVSIIFCSDNYLLDINKRFLSHDYYTDIITFPTEDNERICGELYISVERVKENSNLLRAAYIEELHRVIIHGILHLIGYNDKTSDQKKQMRFVENKWLRLRPIQLIGG